MKIQIKGNEYELKYTLRALFIFERIKGEKFSVATLMDEYLFFYCIILANNNVVIMTFEDFINEIDDKPELMLQYKEFMESEMQKQNIFDSEVDDNKKKV